MRADSGFYTHSVVAVCRKRVRFSITSQHKSLHNIEAIPEDAYAGSLDGRRRRLAEHLHPLPE